MLKYVKRFVLYGSIATLLTGPLIYRIGYNSSHEEIEKVSEDTVAFEYNNNRYLVNLEDLTVKSDKKSLEDLFEK